MSAIALGVAAWSGAHAQELTLRAGATHTVSSVERLSSLVIGQGAKLIAPEGEALTLIVDGVGTPIEPGDYRGRIVLQPSEPVPQPSFFGDKTYLLTPAIYIDDGRYVRAKSVSDVVSGGRVGDAEARDIVLKSTAPKFNGLVVTGRSTYLVAAPVIDLVGNGGDDFVGYGAAIKTDGDAHVTINNARIRTKGAVRPAVLATGHSVVEVNDSDIETLNGVLPSDYQFSVEPGKMMEVPYGMGITGNVRATNVMGDATAYYTRSHIKSQGWGALSTDGGGQTRLFCKDSVVEVTDSGYGAYANGVAQDRFDHCTFNVPDYGLVMTGAASAVLTGGSVVNSGRFGVMVHQGASGGRLDVEGGSLIRTGSTGVLIKGRGFNLVVDGARIEPGDGVLVQTMDNDDPIMRDMAKSGATLPAMPASGGPRRALAMPASPTGDVTVKLKNTRLAGDILHAMRNVGPVSVEFQHAELRGAISTAVATPASGEAPTRETFRQVGDVKDVLKAMPDAKGLDVALDSTSSWTVTRTSYLTRLALAPGARLVAPPGARLTLRVDRAEAAIKPGAYAGALVLEVTPGM